VQNKKTATAFSGGHPQAPYGIAKNTINGNAVPTVLVQPRASLSTGETHETQHTRDTQHTSKTLTHTQDTTHERHTRLTHTGRHRHSL